ncbi:hypothetical protein [Vitiosangium sp. GDMCC 1.1324]|uniref:hypothetical protein n=1 Tax=Vitiosangium sp. (strain GDMCC 1.1324) TaxID=2138576 RepID=UPI0011B76E8A|nr:hypothetical protein [Vitiosangium sp. GDMCC 1.1324]
MKRGLWVRLLLLGAMVLLLDGCATVSGGHIPPSAFEFHDVVDKTGPEPGGWKIAQVNILLTRVSQLRPLQAWCDVEVGVPVTNWKRAISNVTAQRRSAEAADAAAQMVLSGPETVSALACDQFRVEMLRLLREPLKGVRVTKFLTAGIEPKTFPED